MKVVFAFALLYLLPGYAAARIFDGRIRWNPLLWLLLSLLCVPVAMSTLGTLGAPTRNAAGLAIVLLALSGGLYALTGLARRRGFSLGMPPPVGGRGATAAYGLAAILVLVLTALIAATRISNFTGCWPSVGDDMFRLGHVAGIAITGIPPQNAFLPEAALSYYYYDLMLPGLAVRLANPDLGMASAIGAHLVLHTLAVAAATAFVLVRLFPAWPAVLGSFWLLYGAGWDYWPYKLLTQSIVDDVESWAYLTLPGTFSIFQPLTLETWVPQHVIAGWSLLLIAALIRFVRGALWLRAIAVGVVLAFDVGSSVWVSLGIGAGFGIWLLMPLRSATGSWSRRETVLALATAALLCLSLLPVYSGHDSVMRPNFPSTDSALRDSPWAFTVDFIWRFAAAQFTTAWRIPVHLILEGGVPFVLFAVWLWRERRNLLGDPLQSFVAAQGIGLVPLIYFVRTPLYDDIGMRGVISASVCWAIAATWLLASAPPGRTRRVVWMFALVGTLAALPSVAGVLPLGLAGIGNPLPGSVNYINSHTSLDEPFVVADPFNFVKNDIRYPIERIRLMDPWYIREMHPVDQQYFKSLRLLGLPEQPHQLRSRADVCNEAARLGNPPATVLVLARATNPLTTKLGKPVYRDADYAVLAVPCAP